jgi:DNA repair protein RadD
VIPLRPYQEDGIARVRAALEVVSRVLFVLATGGGKTVIASWIVRAAMAKSPGILFVAHRRELIRQTFCKLVRNGIPIDQVGIIMGDTPAAKGGELFPADVASLTDNELWERFGRRRPGAAVHVASIDTLRGRAKLPRVALIIIDEAHRALAASYRKLVDTYPDASVVGLTATPYRADGEGLGDLFEDLVVIASPALLIAEGFLVEPEVWTVPVGDRPDLRGVRTRAGDYVVEQLSAAVDQDGLVGNIVEHWKRRAAGVRTVAFACSVDHSKHIAARFVEAGVRAEHLDGETPTPERDAILGRLERGETLVVSNCGVLTEGWDQPAVKCAILARPTKSTGLYLQCAGRILRPWQGQKAIILDHAGCVVEHGLPQADRAFTLAGDANKRKNAGMGARECPECHAILPPATPQCTACGYIFPPRAAEERDPIEEREGELVLAVGDQLDAALLAKIEAKWQKHNAASAVPRKPGWIAYEFKRKTGRFPPRSYKPPALSEDLAETLARSLELKKQAAAKGYSPAWVHVQAQKLAEMPRAGAEDAAAGPMAPEQATDQPPRSDPAPAPAAPAPRLAPWELPELPPVAKLPPSNNVEFELELVEVNY